MLGLNLQPSPKFSSFVTGQSFSGTTPPESIQNTGSNTTSFWLSYVRIRINSRWEVRRKTKAPLASWHSKIWHLLKKASSYFIILPSFRQTHSTTRQLSPLPEVSEEWSTGPSKSSALPAAAVAFSGQDLPYTQFMIHRGYQISVEI